MNGAPAVTAALIFGADSVIKPGRGGRRAGAGRPRKAIEEKPCPACGQTDTIVEVVGGKRICNCGGEIALAQVLAEALARHIAARPETPGTVARAAFALAVAAVAAAIPASRLARRC